MSATTQLKLCPVIGKRQRPAAFYSLPSILDTSSPLLAKKSLTNARRKTTTDLGAMEWRGHLWGRLEGTWKAAGRCQTT